MHAVRFHRSQRSSLWTWINWMMRVQCWLRSMAGGDRACVVPITGVCDYPDRQSLIAVKKGPSTVYVTVFCTACIDIWTAAHAHCLMWFSRAVWCYTLNCTVVILRWLNMCAIYSASCNGVWTWKRTEGNVLENISFSMSALLVIGQA